MKVPKMNFVTYNVWKTSRTHTHTLLAGRPKLAKNALGTARSFKKSRLSVKAIQRVLFIMQLDK